MKPMPLNIQIQPGDARPIFRQIVEEVRMQIAQGDLEVGAKLPSVRALAQQLLINPNTVAKAYSELTSQGFLESRKGLGIFVKERRQMLSTQEQERRLEEAISRFMNEVVVLDFEGAEILKRLEASLEALSHPIPKP